MTDDVFSLQNYEKMRKTPNKNQKKWNDFQSAHLFQYTEHPFNPENPWLFTSRRCAITLIAIIQISF